MSFVCFQHCSPPESSRWREAAKRIHTELVSPLLPGFSVELIDEKLNQPIRSYQLPREDPLYPSWKAIDDKIQSNEDSFQTFFPLACLRYGAPSTETELKSLPVTVIRTVRGLAKGPFTNEVQRVREMLAKGGLGEVDILFAVDEGWPMIRKPPKDWEIDISWMG